MAVEYATYSTKPSWATTSILLPHTLTTAPTVWVCVRAIVVDFPLLVSDIPDCIPKRWTGFFKKDNMF